MMPTIPHALPCSRLAKDSMPSRDCVGALVGLEGEGLDCPLPRYQFREAASLRKLVPGEELTDFWDYFRARRWAKANAMFQN